MNSLRLIGVVSLMVIICSCSLVKLSGTMTRKTGEAMSDYSKENEGFIGKMAGLGGSINTSVGSAVEDVATKKEEGKDVSFVDANKQVLSSAVSAVKKAPVNDKETIMKAQNRLIELGFNPGTADGIMGNRTRAAIEEYQQKNNLKITKMLDEDTLASLGISKNK